MFDLPNAKRVRRNDLQNEVHSARSNSPDAEISAQLQAKLASYHASIAKTPYPEVPQPKTIETADPEPQDSSYIFRLFSSTPAHTTTESATERPQFQHITISRPASPQYPTADSGAILYSRPLSHYLISASPAWSARQQREFADPSVAVSGSWIRAQSGVRNRGLEVHWRVRRAVMAGKKIRLLDAVVPGLKGYGDGDGGASGAGSRSKPKPNKKRRILIRERMRKDLVGRMELERIREVREREDREKRMRRNREKKVKRKVREKAKKNVASFDNDEIPMS